MQDILNQSPGTQMEDPTHQRPRGAELLFCFDVGPLPTTLAQHETNSGPISCFYRTANTSRHSDLEPAVSLEPQLQRQTQS